MIKRAFTLLEVLIVLAIIGIITVLVLPTFTKNVNNEINATVLKSTFADVTNAFQQAMMDEGVRRISDMDISEKALVKKYFDVSNDCDKSMTPCFAESYNTVVGKNANKTPDCNYSAVISNGASICLSSANVLVDSNGPKAPNVVGRDRFAFSFDDKGQYQPNVTDGSSDAFSKLAKECALSSDFACFELLKKCDWDIDTYSNYLSNVKIKKEKRDKKAVKKAVKKI